MNRRIQRVNQLIQKELSQIFLKEVDFPEGVLATITRVETSANLIQAKVYISVLPSLEAPKILLILKKSIYDIQQRLNKRLKMRPIPRLQFIQEQQTQEAGRIEEIIEEIHKQK